MDTTLICLQVISLDTLLEFMINALQTNRLFAATVIHMVQNAIQDSKRASDALRQTKGLHYLKMVVSCFSYPSASVALQHGSFVPCEGSATRDFST